MLTVIYGITIILILWGGFLFFLWKAFGKEKSKSYNGKKVG
ncbi:hypothetical protein MROS_1736 [Melioribacter roseus P3M-2]|uniref:MetS family NSS transporter small subunit n=1 Tax=Melioribacter roseus (strain DSM 23840 / JCM 17771 / VKM B-2668 / P3M-2) TaxID=1191523 RepID=I6Z734_MELRP|nr:hypothetical protein MROS_1736 [Melioribacter roseus P3M-2]